MQLKFAVSASLVLAIGLAGDKPLITDNERYALVKIQAQQQQLQLQQLQIQLQLDKLQGEFERQRGALEQKCKAGGLELGTSDTGDAGCVAPKTGPGPQAPSGAADPSPASKPTDQPNRLPNGGRDR